MVKIIISYLNQHPPTEVYQFHRITALMNFHRLLDPSQFSELSILSELFQLCELGIFLAKLL